MNRPEGVLPEYVTGERKKFPMQEVVAFLLKEAKKYETSREFEIVGEIGPAEIRALLNLPYEIALTEFKGKVILTTDTGERDVNEPERTEIIDLLFVERQYRSKLSFHTHPIRSARWLFNAPSFSDVLCSERASWSTPLLLAHEGGLMVYREPRINPLTRKKVGLTEETRGLIVVFGELMGVEITGLEKGCSRVFQDLSRAEQASIQRDFAEKTGMILEEADWEDELGVKRIMEYISLKKGLVARKVVEYLGKH